MNDTIAAQATPPGRGGVGIIRISGPKVKTLAEKMLGKVPAPRYADFLNFCDFQGVVIDQGIALYYQAPHSFTGEDVLELQAHGGPVILDRLLRCILSEPDVRAARPGEFSERAYLNDKIDLVQAEAISDLINASTEAAAKSALRSLQGEFSDKINELLERLIRLRLWVEASIDFPEEEIDFIKESSVAQDLSDLQLQLQKIFNAAQQGSVLQEGMTVVIAGQPNAGKSSLLNALSGRDSAIVNEREGTTRDVLREHIQLDGMPLHIVDTAGLRESSDAIEQEGIRRAQREIEKADLVLLVVDGAKYSLDQAQKALPEILKKAFHKIPLLLIKNKIDLLNEKPSIEKTAEFSTLSLSAKENKGIELLKDYLKQHRGFESASEGYFSARRRHLTALERTQEQLEKAATQLKTHQAYELVAEDLRQAQSALSEITGKFTAEDLLGEIFSNFCIGK